MTANRTCKRPLFVAVALAVATACGCGWAESLACDDDCEGGFEEVEGTKADFMLAELDDPRGSVGAAMLCEQDDYADVHVVQVGTHGAQEIASGEWIFERLEPELRRREIRTTSVGLGACTMGDPGIRLSTDDWNAVDPIVDTIFELSEQDDVQVHITLAIEPVPIACPQSACGW